MIWLFLFYCLGPVKALDNNKELTAAVFKFIYGNERLCGDPFSNPDWIPAYDECGIGCDISKNICLISIVNNEQKCNPLPGDCIDALKKEFEWFEPVQQITGDVNVDRFEADMLQREEMTTQPPRTTMEHYSPSAAPSFVTVQNDVFDPYMSAFIQEVEPKTTTSTTSTTTTTSAVTTRLGSFLVESDQSSGAGGYEYPIQNSLEQADTSGTNNHASYGQGTTYPKLQLLKTTTEEPLRVIPGIRISTTQIVYTTTTLPFVIDASDNLFDAQEKPYSRGENWNYAKPSRIDLVPPPPPPDPMQEDDERELHRMIQNFGTEDAEVVYPKATSPYKADSSRRCCEWALNGLCDSHWQKIRKICPKSCGTLVCEEIEGVISCNRFPDIDVEECYQSLRALRYAGVRTLQNQPIEFKPATPIIRPQRLLKIKKLRRKRGSGKI